MVAFSAVAASTAVAFVSGAWAAPNPGMMTGHLDLISAAVSASAKASESESVRYETDDNNDDSKKVTIAAAVPEDDLVWGKWNFLHTTDTHGWLAGHQHQKEVMGGATWGDFANFAVLLKKKAQKLQKDLFIFDTGDTHDGAALSDTTHPDGIFTNELITRVPYDALTIGNHELYKADVSADVYKNFAPFWKDRYITSNAYIRDAASDTYVPIGSKYTTFTGTFGTRVLAFGFIFDFKDFAKPNSSVAKVAEEVRQPWFNRALDDYVSGVDLVVVLGHSGVHGPEFQTVHDAIRNHTQEARPDLPILFFGGHHHVRDFKVFDTNSYGIASGKYFESVGWMSVTPIPAPHSTTFGIRTKKNDAEGTLQLTRTFIDASPEGFKRYVDMPQAKNLTAALPLGAGIASDIVAQQNLMNTSFVFGCVPQNYYLDRYPHTDSRSLFNMLEKDIMHRVVPKPGKENSTAVIMNTGSQRFDIFEGPFTLDDQYVVSPFADRFVHITDLPLAVVSRVKDKLNSGAARRKLLKRRRLERRRSTAGSQSTVPAGQQIVTGDEVCPPGMTYGDVTDDDWSRQGRPHGDNIAHCILPQYELPGYVGSTLAEVTAENANDLYDLVFFEFFTDYVNTALNAITGTQNYTQDEYQAYDNDGVSGQNLWARYASIAWPCKQ